MYLYLSLVAAGLVAGTLIPVPVWLLIITVLLALIGRYALSFKYPITRVLWLIGPLVAAFWSSQWIGHQLSHRLPVEYDRTAATLLIEVREVIPRGDALRLQVRVKGSAQEEAPEVVTRLRHLQLNWYRPVQAVQIGEQWRAEVVLRSPRNFLNDLPFDYEAYLLSRGIDATGYIRSATLMPAAKVSPGWRQQLIDWQRRQHQEEAWPWLAGLIFGEQAAFTAEQWQLAEQTGTLHLLVVSGLHVGLMTLLGLSLWAIAGRLLLLAGGQGIQGVLLPRFLLVLLFTGGYVWLAGAGIALQRAWIMLLVFLLLQQSRFCMRWPLALCAAVVAVLIVNPLIWTRPGFGLSFLAVLGLVAFFLGRNSSRMESLWLPQIVAFAVLMPLLLWWGQPVSLLQCLANLLAIPLLSLVLLPLTLLAALLRSQTLDSVLVMVGDAYWWLLQYMENIPLPFMAYAALGWLLLWSVWLVLMQRGVSGAALWPAMLLLSLWFVRTPALQPQIVLADVGQGQSFLAISPGGVLVYDAGPRFSEYFDAGSAIVRPLLQRYGVASIDTLIISHADVDHAGGLAALQNGFRIAELWGGESIAEAPELRLCHHESDKWRVLSDQVIYRYLDVPTNDKVSIKASSNNASCVVQLDWYGQRFLLTGDIGTDVEALLVKQYGHELRSDILLVGHHGSNSSSSEAFLRAVQPREAWISAGFNNRFGHPARAVTERLELLQIPWRNTATEGALHRSPEGVTIGRRQMLLPRWRQP